MPLQTSIQYAHVAISLFDENGKSFTYGYVPIVVAKCGVFLKKKGKPWSISARATARLTTREATEVEGIFRLAGAERRIKELQVIFNSPERYGKGLDWSGYTVHDAANILRRYLNQLPEPIVPFSFYHRFRQPLKGHQAEAVGEMDLQEPNIGGFDVDATIKTYQQLITELPALNRQLLLYILDLLAVFASKSDVNRMNASNLSAIFQPGLLGLREHDMMPKEYRLSQDVLIFLIENQDSFLVGMQGTAADEKTIQEVQAGAAAHKTTGSTGSAKRAPGVGRTASNASAGAESVRKYGGVRRNVSTSSRRSRQSGHTPSPVTPPESPFTASGKSGVHRSNTVPSKKSQSPAMSGSRFQKDSSAPSSGSSRLTTIEPTTQTQTQTTTQEREPPRERLSPHLRPVDKRTGSRERPLTMDLPPPGFVSTSPGGTPSKERPYSVFKSSPAGLDKRPNKLQKKRPEGGNLGTRGSNASLTALGYPPSPGYSRNVSAQTDAQRLDATAQMLEQVSENHEVVPPTATAPTSEVTKETQMTNTDPPESSTVSAQIPQTTTQKETNVQENAKKEPSPTASVNSRSTEGAHREASASAPANGESTAERSLSVPEIPGEEKKGKKHSRWRLSTSARREPPPPSFGSSYSADVSTSTVGSAGPPRKSLTEESLGDTETSGHSERKGPLGWFKNKLQDRRERDDAKERQKSPPPTGNRAENESKPSFSGLPMPTVSESGEAVPGGSGGGVTEKM